MKQEDFLGNPLTDEELEDLKKARSEFWAVIGSFAVRFIFLIVAMYVGMCFMAGGGTCTF